jgi:BirA family biotin operon repressor/biotin-[acetyl-CoA-carboxylase] ligase
MTDVEEFPFREPDPGWITRNVVRLTEVDSTNLEVWRQAEAGAPHGLVVLAEHQTAGRGRLDRKWLSPAGEGVYLSILLRPGLVEAGANLIGVGVGVATSETVEDLGVRRSRVKWPNDVYVGERKISGILTEARDAGTEDAVFVVGIGINVLQEAFPDDLRAPATSLRIETGREPTIDEVVDALLPRQESWIDAVLQGHLAALDAAFDARDMLKGRRIRFDRSRETFEGEVLSISPLHGVVLRLPSGVEKRFPPDHVNEVRILTEESPA